MVRRYTYNLKGYRSFAPTPFESSTPERFPTFHNKFHGHVRDWLRLREYPDDFQGDDQTGDQNDGEKKTKSDADKSELQSRADQIGKCSVLANFRRSTMISAAAELHLKPL